MFVINQINWSLNVITFTNVWRTDVAISVFNAGSSCFSYTTASYLAHFLPWEGSVKEDEIS